MFAFLLLFTIRYCYTEMITSTLIYVFQLCVHLLLSFTVLFVYSSSSFPYMSFRASYEWSMISRCKWCHIPSRQHHPTTPKTTSYTSRGEGGGSHPYPSPSCLSFGVLLSFSFFSCSSTLHHSCPKPRPLLLLPFSCGSLSSSPFLLFPLISSSNPLHFALPFLLLFLISSDIHMRAKDR